MPFEKFIDKNHLRYRWKSTQPFSFSLSLTPSSHAGPNPDWTFVEFLNRRGKLYVRIDSKQWEYYCEDGTPAKSGEVERILGRESAAKRLIEEKIHATSKPLRKQPHKGNPYGRFDEDSVVGVLAEYTTLYEVDFLEVACGDGLRILDEGFIEIYKSIDDGYPPVLQDEFDRNWKRLSGPSQYRPWGIYVLNDNLTISGLPSNELVKLVHGFCDFPQIKSLPATCVIDGNKLDVIATEDRKNHPSQKAVMKNKSASDVARALGLPDHKWEWLHLIAFSLGGHQGTPQVPENLVLGTAEANTAMMVIESFIKEVLRHRSYKEATLVVSRHCPVEDCAWYTTYIVYTIKFETSWGSKVYVKDMFHPFQQVGYPFALQQMTSLIHLHHRIKSGDRPRPVSDTIRKPAHKRPGRRL